MLFSRETVMRPPPGLKDEVLFTSNPVDDDDVRARTSMLTAREDVNFNASLPAPLIQLIHRSTEELVVMYETSREVAKLLREMADAVEENRPVAVMLADESILIPADAHFRVEYDRGAGAREVVIRVTWGLTSTIPVLIHTHSEKVQNSLGNLYSVVIYGEPRTDGTWEGWLEFVPASAALRTLRTSRETTQPNRSALEYWASGLEPLYLAGAFERAA